MFIQSFIMLFNGTNNINKCLDYSEIKYYIGV